MSNIDLANKAVYDMINDNVTQENDTPSNGVKQVSNGVKQATATATAPALAPSKPLKMERSFKGFFIFVFVIIFIGAFIYFTIYRLGWGIKECVNKNFHDCAALLTPEVAPLAAAGILALI
jgi:hypothetical protein